MNYREIREACCDANRSLPEKGLIDLTFGNVSVLDPSQGVFAIKPSGVDYDALTPEAMVIVNLSGDIVEGELRPSSDTPTHRCLFQAFAAKGICSIVHTHSRNAVAFAQAGIALPCYGTTHCDYFNGAVPITRMMTQGEVENDYEWNTGQVILELFEGHDPTEMPAALVRNHGPFAWGESAAKAVENALALEIVADMAKTTLALNSNTQPVHPYLLTKHFSRKHGKNAYYGQA